MDKSVQPALPLGIHERAHFIRSGFSFAILSSFPRRARCTRTDQSVAARRSYKTSLVASVVAPFATVWPRQMGGRPCGADVHLQGRHSSVSFGTGKKGPHGRYRSCHDGTRALGETPNDQRKAFICLTSQRSFLRIWSRRLFRTAKVSARDMVDS